MMTEERDAWWGPVALLMLLIAFSMDLLVWQLSGGTEFSSIIERAILGFTLAFGLTSFALLLISLSGRLPTAVCLRAIHTVEERALFCQR